MGASYNKSVLKSRAARGAKAGAEADWGIGWSLSANREAAPEDSGRPPSAPARSGPARSGPTRSNAAKRSANDANAKIAHD